MVLGNVNCLSMKFAATASPLNTLKHAGRSSFRTSCDTNEKCKFETNDKAECIRVGCCWNDILNSCSVMKIHFEKLCSGDSCEKYQHWFVKEDKYFDDARQYCRETYQGDIIQYDPRLFTMQGRSELLEIIGITAAVVGSTYANFKIGIMYDASSGTWKRVGDGQDVILEGWHSGAPDDSGDYLYAEWFFNVDSAYWHNYVDNFSDYSEPFICERVNY